MSNDVIRNYTGKYGSIGRKRRRRRKQPKYGLYFLFILFIAGIVAFEMWSTSDRYPMEHFVPTDQDYLFFINDIHTAGTQVASSQVWNALPESMHLGWVPTRINADFPIPDWVRNNFIDEKCCIAGNDFQEFSDEIFITKTTWIGSLIDDLYWLLPMIHKDNESEISIRKWPKGNRFFAVRGRVLIASPSREALVKLLISSRDSQDTVKNILDHSGTENFKGTIS